MKRDIARPQLSSRATQGLCCPYCQQSLTDEGDQLRCTAVDCARVFPVIAGIPILINEDNSLFSANDYRDLRFPQPQDKIRPTFPLRFLPEISLNLSSPENFRRFAQLLCEQTEKPLVLVVGGRIPGKGMDIFSDFPDIELVSSDIALGPSTQLISDAHDIPFKDQYFNGVIAQAVLEHVLDPWRCVSEIHRVLKPQGLVYAETPFMQQVHEGRYDFTRFTHLGHRRLFRWFSEIDSGPTGGPGMALAWAIRYFVLSFSARDRSRKWLGGAVRLTAFFWKYFDPWLARSPGGYDAASGYYFLGSKNEDPLSDRKLIQQYRGAIA